LKIGQQRLEDGQERLEIRLSVVELRMADVEKTQKVVLTEVRGLATKVNRLTPSSRAKRS
jgi:HAMP domain-containing protein